MHRRLALALTALAFAACDDGDDAAPIADAAADDAAPVDARAADAVAEDGGRDAAADAGAGPEGFAVAGGLWVGVEDDRLVLRLPGERALRFAAAPVVARTYTEAVMGPLGIYNFTRRDEQPLPFAGAPTLDFARDAVVVPAEGGATATLTFAAGPVPDSTRLTVTVDGAPFDSLALGFDCAPEATFFGWGEQYDAVDHRGHAFDLLVSEQGVGREGARLIAGDAHTTYFPMPWWFDAARGFGVLFETFHRVRVDLCAADPAVATIEDTAGAPLEVVLFHGPAPLDVVRQLGAHVGRPKRPPDWAFEAPWISAQGGTEAVRAAIATLDAEQVPYAAIWSQDWTGVRTNIDGGLGVQYRWEADLEHYPGLAALGADLQAAGKRFLGYANPFVDPNLPNHFAAMAAEGLLVRDADGDAYRFTAPNGVSGHPDLTRPETAAYIAAALTAKVEDYGFDGWMVDFGEWAPFDAVYADDADAHAEHNRFPLRWQAVTRGVFETLRPDGDWVMFARSGWTGVQAHSMIHWAGDQEATWSTHDGLPTVVPALLSLGLAGVPYVTHDIGGFSGGPSTKELYQRWVELGAFTPIMRTHEGNRRQANWDWDRDADTLAHFRRFARVHAALMPEWRALADEAAMTSAPMLRHLALVFPDDAEARAVDDQFLIGDDLLVAPVVTEGAVSREVYLPAGAWFHVFTGAEHAGPGRVTVDAPIGTPPVFSRGADRVDLRGIE